MIPVETITPAVTATINTLQSVPLENMAYVPMDVFTQYTYIQMLIDGVVAGAIGFVLGWKIHQHREDKKKNQHQPKPVAMYRGQPPRRGSSS